MTTGRTTAVAHLSDSHGFGFDDLENGVPADPLLEEIHGELHAQEDDHDLATHRHRAVLVEFQTGEVFGLFEREEEALAYALHHFGEVAGKEYGIRLAWDESDD